MISFEIHGLSRVVLRLIEVLPEGMCELPKIGIVWKSLETKNFLCLFRIIAVLCRIRGYPRHISFLKKDKRSAWNWAKSESATETSNLNLFRCDWSAPSVCLFSSMCRYQSRS